MYIELCELTSIAWHEWTIFYMFFFKRPHCSELNKSMYVLPRGGVGGEVEKKQKLKLYLMSLKIEYLT